MLGAGAMVIYLKLQVQGIEELVKLRDEGPSALSECLHHLAGILPGKYVLGSAVRAAFPFYHDILSRSFSRGVEGGGVGDGAFARHAVRQLRTITWTDDSEAVGAESPLHKHCRGTRSSCQGKPCWLPLSTTALGLIFSLAVGSLPLNLYKVFSMQAKQS